MEDEPWKIEASPDHRQTPPTSAVHRRSSTSSRYISREVRYTPRLPTYSSPFTLWLRPPQAAVSLAWRAIGPQVGCLRFTRSSTSGTQRLFVLGCASTHSHTHPARFARPQSASGRRQGARLQHLTCLALSWSVRALRLEDSPSSPPVLWLASTQTVRLPTSRHYTILAYRVQGTRRPLHPVPAIPFSFDFAYEPGEATATATTHDRSRTHLANSKHAISKPSSGQNKGLRPGQRAPALASPLFVT